MSSPTYTMTFNGNVVVPTNPSRKVFTIYRESTTPVGNMKLYMAWNTFYSPVASTAPT